MAAFESDDFDLDDIKLFDSNPFRRVRIDQAHKTSKCRQITGLEKFLQTGIKNFLDWSTRNGINHSLETAKINERQDGSSYSRVWQAGMFSGYKGPYNTIIEVLRTRLQCVSKSEFCAQDQDRRARKTRMQGF